MLTHSAKRIGRPATRYVRWEVGIEAVVVAPDILGKTLNMDVERVEELASNK